VLVLLLPSEDWFVLGMDCSSKDGDVPINLNIMVDVKEWTTEVCVSVVAFRESAKMLDFCVNFLIERGLKKATFYLRGNCFAGQNRRFWRKVQNCHEVIFGLSHLRRGQNLFQVANFWQLRAQKSVYPGNSNPF